MKKIILSIMLSTVLFVFSSGFLYGLFSFALWSLNPLIWGDHARLLFSVSMLANLFFNVIFCLSIYDKIKEK